MIRDEQRLRHARVLYLRASPATLRARLAALDVATSSQPAVRTLGPYGDKLAAVMGVLMPKTGLAGLVPIPLGANLSLSLAALPTDQLSALLGSARDKFCTPGTITPARKVPAVLRGPQLNITLATGNCSLALGSAGSGALPNKTVACYGPAVSYSRVRSTRMCMRVHARGLACPLRARRCHAPRTAHTEPDHLCRQARGACRVRGWLVRAEQGARGQGGRDGAVQVLLHRGGGARRQRLATCTAQQRRRAVRRARRH